MVFQFGDIRFDILNSPSSFRVEESMNFIPVERINNKPLIQELGIPLITIDMDIQLRWQFIDVPTAIAQLRKAMYDSQEHELLDGDGHTYGVFKIQKMSQEITQVDSRGRVLSAEISLTFLEYSSYDDEQGEKDSARQRAFANISVNPIEVTKKDIYSTPNALASKQITLAASQARSATANVKKAVSAPTLTYKHVQTGIRQLRDASATIQQAKTQLNKVTTAISNLAYLKTMVTNVGDSIDTLIPALSGASDAAIPGLVSGSVAALDSQVTGMTSAASILTAFTALRR